MRLSADTSDHAIASQFETSDHAIASQFKSQFKCGFDSFGFPGDRLLELVFARRNILGRLHSYFSSGVVRA